MAEVDIRLHVSRTVFRPRPKVDSALVRIGHRAEAAEIADEELFAVVVRRAFGQRRKKLSNALKDMVAGEALDELGLEDARAEEVAVADYLEIVRRLLT